MYLKLNWKFYQYDWAFAGNSSFVTPLPLYCENLTASEDSTQHAKPKVAHPVLSDDGIGSILHSVETQLLVVNVYINAISFSFVSLRLAVFFDLSVGQLLYGMPFG